MEPNFFKINIMIKQFLTCFLLFISASSIQARGTYLEPELFLKQSFNSALPQAKKIWLTGEVGKTVTKILQHKPDQLRLRYWQQKQRFVWILNETGKDKPITAGFVIDNNKIQSVKVLIFRESRGDEIRHDFFTRQFKQAKLKPDTQLDRNVDGISGATMSVRALTKLSRIALYLSSQINKP